MRTFPLCFALSGLAFLSSGCSMHYSLGSGPTYYGSGHKHVDTRSVPQFDEIELLGSMDLQAHVGEATRVVVSGDDNLLEHVITDVHGSRLEVRLEDGSYRMKKPLIVTVYTPDLELLSLKGSGDALIVGLDQDELTLTVMGSGDVEAHGMVRKLVATVKGSGDMSLRELEARHAEVSVMGSGDISLHASDSIDASVKGSGDISYWGSPDVRNVSALGSGDITAH